MASNHLPDSNDKLFPLADDMVDRLHKHGDEVGVKQFTEAVLTSKLAVARQTRKYYNRTQKAETDATSARDVANSNVKAFVAAGKGILLKPLGSKPSQDWEALGYPTGTIAMPDSVEGRLAVVTGMRDYLKANPGKAVTSEDIVFTEAEAESLRKALADARKAVNDVVAARVKTKGRRDATVDDLRTAMSGLVGELGHIPLGDDSLSWYWFGLVPPGGSETPGVPDSVYDSPGRTYFRRRRLRRFPARDELPALQERRRGQRLHSSRPNERARSAPGKPSDQSDRPHPIHRP